MRIALTAFTRRGAALAERLARELDGDCVVELGRKLAGTDGYDSVKAWAGERFRDADALVFVGACGIAVRAVAPYVRDKFTDPAVVCVDEAGRFAVPLLSGHVGGANELAKRIAALTGGAAAIGTATDVNGLLSIDCWAVERGLTITDRRLAKAVSAALLDGEAVGFASDFGQECPPGLSAGRESLGVRVTARKEGGPFERTLRLVPRCLRLGIGCRKGTSVEAVRAAVERALTGWDLAAVMAVHTIDLKRNEPGLLAFADSLGLPLTVHTAEELRAVEGEFTPSEFVRSVAGVDNVCERAAVLGGGTLIIRKQAANGVTVAAALDATTIEGELT